MVRAVTSPPIILRYVYLQQNVHRTTHSAPHHKAPAQEWEAEEEEEEEWVQGPGWSGRKTLVVICSVVRVVYLEVNSDLVPLSLKAANSFSFADHSCSVFGGKAYFRAVRYRSLPSPLRNSNPRS
jgi:predicted cobalt transporter CbtA